MRAISWPVYLLGVARRSRWTEVLCACAVVVGVGFALLVPTGAASTAVEVRGPVIRGAGPGEIVTLVTGDRVRVTDRGAGQRMIDLLPGSPSYGENPLIFGTAEATYVIPQLSNEVRSRLDYSMFNITALAEERGASVPVRVEFAPGASTRDVAGLEVDTSTVERSDDGARVADAVYVPGESDVDPGEWSGVRRVWRAGPSERATPTDRAKRRTLRITVKGRSGKLVKRADAWVQNVDNGRLFNKPVEIRDGQARVSVPKGNYAVFAWGAGFVGRPELAVRKNRPVRLSFAASTVRPKVTVKGARLKGFALVKLSRRPEKGRSFSVVGNLGNKLQPMRGRLAHGHLDTSITASFARKAPYKRPDTFTRDTVRGIPRDLRFRHDKSDFARIPLRVHGDGGQRHNFWGYAVEGRVPSLDRDGSMVLGFGANIGTPARTMLWVQGDRKIIWDLGVFSSNAYIYRHLRYRPGAAKPLEFLAGPVGPGVERGIDARRTDRGCMMCRVGNRLRGRLPLASSAGTRDWSRASGRGISWVLRDRHKVLDRMRRGDDAINPAVNVPAKERRYTLRATSDLGAGWRTSTPVSTAWGFASGKVKRGVVPLLMPSYRPPVSLTGRAKPGEVSYRLNFGNLGPAESRIAKASLRYTADDGDTWHRANLKRLDKNSFKVTYRNPRPTGKHKYVGLRVRATDTAGGTVKETAIRVYRLKGA